MVQFHKINVLRRADQEGKKKREREWHNSESKFILFIDLFIELWLQFWGREFTTGLAERVWGRKKKRK